MDLDQLAAPKGTATELVEEEQKHSGHFRQSLPSAVIEDSLQAKPFVKAHKTQEQKTAQLSPIPTGGRKSEKALKERKRDLKRAMKATQGMKQTISVTEV